MIKAGSGSRVDLGSFNKYAFDRGAGRPKEFCWFLVKTLFFLTPFPFPSRFKVFFLRLFGAKVGSSVVIRPRVHIYMPWRLEIGHDVWIGEEAYLLNLAQVSIGSNVIVSQRAFICTGNHDYTDPAMSGRHQPVLLEDGVWLGAASFVGPGVQIGTDTVVSAGAVVTSNLGMNSIYKGNPAVFIRHRWQD